MCNRIPPGHTWRILADDGANAAFGKDQQRFFAGRRLDHFKAGLPEQIGNIVAHQRLVLDHQHRCRTQRLLAHTLHNDRRTHTFPCMTSSLANERISLRRGAAATRAGRQPSRASVDSPRSRKSARHSSCRRLRALRIRLSRCSRTLAPTEGPAPTRARADAVAAVDRTHRRAARAVANAFTPAVA